MKILKLMLLFMLSALPVYAQHTYYVSISTGADSNTAALAQSKSTPWKNLPGMPAATGMAASYKAVPGDTFILKGCDVWYNTAGKSSFPISLTNGGSSAAPVKITVDQTWFNPTCSVWNRPIFDAHTSAVSNTPTQMGGSLSGCVGVGGNEFVNFNASYITLDWIEMRNLFYANDAEGSCYGGNSMWQVNDADFITVSNSYEHGWKMGTFSSTVNDTDTLVFVLGSPACPHCLMTHNVANNCDATGTTGPFPGGTLAMTNILYSVFKCQSNAYKPTLSGEFGWNEITLNGASPDNTIHPNCIETLIANGNNGTYFIHDNRVHDNLECEEGQIGNPSETDYIWNNIWWNQLGVGANTPQVPQSETPISMFFFNNIVVDGGVCIHDASHGYTWSKTFLSQNNLCINSAGSSSSGSPTASTVTISNNLGMTDSQATAAGLTSSESFVFSPTSNSAPTVGKGLNLTSLMPPGFTAQDSSVVCGQQIINTVIQVVCTGTAHPRPASGAWDLGAYQFVGGVFGQPVPPTNIQGVVQ
jgi:hypothetical protein